MADRFSPGLVTGRSFNGQDSAGSAGRRADYQRLVEWCQLLRPCFIVLQWEERRLQSSAMNNDPPYDPLSNDETSGVHTLPSSISRPSGSAACRRALDSIVFFAAFVYANWYLRKWWRPTIDFNWVYCFQHRPTDIWWPASSTEWNGISKLSQAARRRKKSNQRWLRRTTIVHEKRVILRSQNLIALRHRCNFTVLVGTLHFDWFNKYYKIVK